MMRDLLARMRGLRFHNAIRWLAVQHLYEGRSQAWVAAATFMSPRTVRRIWERWRKTGTVEKNSGERGRPPKLNKTEQKWLLRLIKEDPTLYLDELAMRVSVKTKTAIHASPELGGNKSTTQPLH